MCRAGAFLIDGQDIRSVSQTALREKIAVVPQETALFNRSIRENIRHRRPDASDERGGRGGAQRLLRRFHP